VAIIEINCKDVWREVSNYVDGDIDAELRQRMEAHFAKCAHCTAILDGTRNVLRLVGDGKAFDLPSGFTDRLRKRIEKATT
jgi:anti-sigma factor RsiW